MKNKCNKVEWHEKTEDNFIHIEFTRFGYATLCGLAAEGTMRYGTDFLKKTNKNVTCDSCKSLYEFCNSIKI